jgi:amidase
MLFDNDATYYAKQVKNKDVTVTELIERALKNIEKMNPELNAITHVQAEEALEKAREYDENLAALSKAEIQQFPPFYGVPILLKDLGQAEADQPDTSGAKLLKDYVTPETDNFVQHVLDGGFIVVGRTNVPEFGFKNESDSDFSGAVHSPFDPQLNPGGSSGGAAAALKAGIVPIVTASDGGGSIRIPASLNGLIGLKTSRGRTPVGPGSYRGWQGATVNFALTKSVRDTWEMLKVMQIEQYDAPFVLPRISETELKPLDKKLKFAYSFEHPVHKEVSEDAKNTVQTAVDFLSAAGHTVEEKTPDTDGVKAMQTYYIVNGVETAAMIEGIETGMDRSVELDDMEVMSWALYRAGYNISGIEYSKVLAFWDQLTAQMEAFFEEYDALILPATNGPAFPQNHFERSPKLVEKLKNIDNYNQEEQQDLIWEMFDESLAYTPFTQQQNLTGQPAISLPLYETTKGLPIGTQIWTKKGAEYLLLQIAGAFEEAGLIHTEIIDLKA